MSVLAEVSIYPVDQGESLSDHVAKAVQVIRDSGLSYQLGPMGTVVEAESAAAIFTVIDKAMQAVQSDSRRVEAVIKLDWRAERSGGINAKVDSVIRKIDGDPGR